MSRFICNRKILKNYCVWSFLSQNYHRCCLLDQLLFELSRIFADYVQIELKRVELSWVQIAATSVNSEITSWKERQHPRYHCFTKSSSNEQNSINSNIQRMVHRLLNCYTIRLNLWNVHKLLKLNEIANQLWRVCVCASMHAINTMNQLEFLSVANTRNNDIYFFFRCLSYILSIHICNSNRLFKYLIKQN